MSKTPPLALAVLTFITIGQILVVPKLLKLMPFDISDGQTTAPPERNNLSIVINQATTIIQPRAFPPWPKDTPLPCFPPEEDMWERQDDEDYPTKRGFFFNKLMKTGSSTAAGVHLRMVRSIANKTGLKDEWCQLRGTEHAPTSEIYPNRTRGESFLWTMVRDPTSRAVSQFFHFEVTREGTNATDENFQEYVIDDWMTENLYVRYLSRLEYHITWDESTLATLTQEIVDDYDFIGVVERFDESIVVLQMLLRLSTADVLYLKAKGSGAYDDGGYKQTCFVIKKSFVSPGMKAFFQGEEWQWRIRWDQILYQVANKSLDMTIDQLGRSEFEANLARFHHAQKIVQDKCLKRTKFPCSDEGHKLPWNETDCIEFDQGCGYKCIDRVARMFGL